MLMTGAASGSAFTGEVAFSNPLTYSCTGMESFLPRARPGAIKSLATGVTNIAAYRPAKLLGLNMASSYVRRTLAAATGSLFWWVKRQFRTNENLRDSKNLSCHRLPRPSLSIPQCGSKAKGRRVSVCRKITLQVVRFRQ